MREVTPYKSSPIWGATPGVTVGAPPTGVTLRLGGVGFKGFSTGGWGVWGLGYSHYLGLRLPRGSILRVHRQGVLLRGPNNLVHRVVHLRRPDPYKGRGIVQGGVTLRLKPGKRR